MDDDGPPFDDEPPPEHQPPRGRRTGGRTPPHNLDAERALLGALLLSRDAVMDVAEVLPGSDVFYRPAHAHVYETVMVLSARGEVADPITVADELRRRNLLDAAGGTAALVDLQADAPGTANAAHYARIVKDHSLLRRLIMVSGTAMERAYGVPEDVRQVLDEAEAAVLGVRGNERSTTTIPLSDAVSGALAHIETLTDRKDEITGVPTGFYDLDDLTSGLQPGALVVVGARPAMGKTSLALALARAAVGAGLPAIVFSMEMSQIELTMRMLGSEARVDARRLRNGRLTDGDWNSIAQAIGRLGDLPLYWDDDALTTVMDIRTKARRVRREHGQLGLVVVDYVQLMTPHGRRASENRQLEISEISRGLKLLARELECPVVALSQLNRGLEQRADKRPLLSDLRESGALEQDADVVMFLYRDEIYEPTPDNQGLAELIVAKQRNGPTGVVRLSWMGHLTKFASTPRDPR
jgi:replicative DNA helicase